MGKQSKIPRCPMLFRFFDRCPCMLNMADMLAGFGELINSAISECDINFQSIPLLNVEKERIESNLLEKLPEDYYYKFNLSVINEQKSSFQTEDITAENVHPWVIEFQTINSITLKVKTKKKRTTGYLIQTYFRCQHNTRRWSQKRHIQ
jgi:hypothetical protein